MAPVEFPEDLITRANKLLSERVGRSLEATEVAAALRALAGAYEASFAHFRKIAMDPDAFLAASFASADRLGAIFDPDSVAWFTVAHGEAYTLARVGVAIERYRAGEVGLRQKAAEGRR